MVNIHIKNSYKTWRMLIMRELIRSLCCIQYGNTYADEMLNRSYRSMYIEWYLHNIGYYLTKPFCKVDAIRKLNMRFKDVDLERWEKT